MVTSCTDREHPYFKALSAKSSKDSIKFFEDESSRFRFVSLGEALDFVSWGGINYVAYSMNTKGLAKFVFKWMRAQTPKVDYEEVPVDGIKGAYRLEEKSREYGYRWNDFRHQEDVELPRINHEHCPRNQSHTGEISDLSGMLRCTHIDRKFVKPSFTETHEYYDDLSRMDKLHYSESKPWEPPFSEEDEEGHFIDYSPEWEEYNQQMKMWNSEDRQKVEGVCYAVIKEPADLYLPLGTVFDRVNHPNHRNSKITVHPFSGFTLANFVAAWYNQKGRKRFWARDGEFARFNAVSAFWLYNSDD